MVTREVLPLTDVDDGDDRQSTVPTRRLERGQRSLARGQKTPPINSEIGGDIGGDLLWLNQSSANTVAYETRPSLE